MKKRRKFKNNEQKKHRQTNIQNLIYHSLQRLMLSRCEHRYTRIPKHNFIYTHANISTRLKKVL